MIKVIEKDINELVPYENNARINDKAVDVVANSIEEFGFKQPIIIDKNNVIVAGHTRTLACKKLGITKVPCIVADDLTEEQIKAFRIADNSSAQVAEWDMDKLMAELETIDYDMSKYGLAEQMAEIEKIIEENKEVEDDDYEMPEDIEIRIKAGEIWQLGNHRLMCGDSTKEEDVAKLMNGDKADLLFTDPPYNVSMESKSKEILKSENYSHIENDDLPLEEFKEFLGKVFVNANNSLKDNASYYVFSCQGGDNEMMMMMMMRQSGIKCRHQIIWVKDAPVFSMGRLDYDYKHEPILYGWKKKHNFYRKGEQDKSVWEFKRTANKLHPTMKPIELIANALQNSTKQNDLVLDLFGGSGSTLIACEQLNRKCYIMELDPKYVQVIIERYIAFTGKEVYRLNNDGTKTKWSEIVS